ncbi:MAG: hypothetical protein ABII96_03435 [Candidatus Zixiibacteriota bacterium]
MLNFHKRTNIINLCILLSAICILFLSCFNPFSPSVIGPGALKPIAPQVDPDSVLYNFKYAYENRDSVVYENCLDPEFLFLYKDQDQYTNIEEEISVPRDGISGDIYRTKFLFRVFEDIHLDTWKTTAAYDTSVDGETWKVRRVEFHLLLQDMNGEYQSLGAYGYADFLFRQSNKDNFWRIVRWVDRSI